MSWGILVLVAALATLLLFSWKSRKAFAPTRAERPPIPRPRAPRAAGGAKA